MNNHILWPPERAKKKSACCHIVRRRIFHHFFLNFWFKNKDTILFTNHFDLGLKENSLKIDWDPVELSGKTAMISTKPRPSQSYYLSWIDHLVGKSSFKRETEVFSFYIIGEMFRANELFVDLVAASRVFIFYYLIRNDLSGAPNVNFRKISVRKTIWDLEFSGYLLWNFLLACLS